MAHVLRSALVSYSADKMFKLVNDVESYPQFMTGCVGAELLGQGEGWIEARLDLSRGGIKQSFSTHNKLDPPNRITISLLEGPFSSFQSHWTFTEIASDACKIEFEIKFELKNKLISFALGKILEAIASEQVDNICDRAKFIYAD